MFGSVPQDKTEALIRSIAGQTGNLELLLSDSKLMTLAFLCVHVPLWDFVQGDIYMSQKVKQLQEVWNVKHYILFSLKDARFQKVYNEVSNL